MRSDRIKSSFRIGRVVEQRWLSAVPESIKSSPEDDKKKHIDFYVDLPSHSFSVDVKGNNPPHEIWLEIKNVNVDTGWLYGEATHIAFDIPEMGGFVMVLSEVLREYVANNVKKEFVTKRKAYKKLYTRKDRSDVITYLTITDLLSLPHKVVTYSNKYNHPVTGEQIQFNDRSRDS